MPRPRRRIFGPLFYATLVVAVLVGAYSALDRLGSIISDWREVRSLVQTLRGADPHAREMAAARLEQRGPGFSTPFLLEAASDTRAELRALACRCLVMASADLSELLPVFSTAARDSQEEVRREAACALGRVAWRAAQRVPSSSSVPGRGASDVGIESIKVLRRLLQDQSSAVRTAAAEALAEFGPDPAAAADLIAATSDEDRSSRFAAAVALLKVNGPSDKVAARTLISLVADPEGVPDRLVVFEALKGTSAEVHDQALAALLALLSNGDPAIFIDVIACLQAAGPRARTALPALEALLKSDDPGIRAQAGLAIVSIDGQETPRSVATLIRIVVDPKSPQDARESAIFLLREANRSVLASSTPNLIRQLADADAAVRQNAVSLLSMIIEDTRAELPVPTYGK